MKHVLMYSGGVASAVSGFRLVEKYGKKNVVFLFCDTKMEDEDLYRFNADVEGKLGIKIETITEGRTPWDVYVDTKYLGNDRVAKCSQILKFEPALRWVNEKFQPKAVTVYLGYYADELDRLSRAASRWYPFRVRSALLKPFPSVGEMGAREFLQKHGLELPRLYKMGFLHNNCGGFCCRAGKAHFKRLLMTMPCRFAFHEKKEQEIREQLGDVSILTDTDGGRLTLQMLRERVEAKKDKGFDDDQASGCNCFTGDS